MKRIFAICLALSMSSLWQQPLGKTYGLRSQNVVMVNESFASREPRRFRQHQFTCDKMFITFTECNACTNLKHLQI